MTRKLRTTIGVYEDTKAKFELAKEAYYGEDVAGEITHDKFINDLLDDVLECDD